MEKISLVFLGTSAAVPTKKRNTSAILLNYKNENILIDCGEGTQRQMKIAGINFMRLTKILITHWHGDHILGLPGLLQTMALQKYNKKLIIYGPIGSKIFLKKMLGDFVFRERIKIEVKEIKSGKFFENKDFILEAKPLKHSTKTLGYSFIEKNKLKLIKAKLIKAKITNHPKLALLKRGKTVIIKGKKLSPKNFAYKEKGRKISFILDTQICKNCIELARGADLLIAESSFTEKEKELAKERKHLTAKQAAEIAKKIKCKKLILTHISQRYQKNLKEVLKEAKKIFKKTELARDFLKITI